MVDDGGKLNGFDVARLQAVAKAFDADPDRGRGNVSFTSRWTGEGEAAETEVEDQLIRTGEDGGVGGADLVLAAVSACVVATVARRATLLGIELQELACQVDGELDLRRYAGAAQGGTPGYGRVGMKLRVRAPGASEAEIDRLREACMDSPAAGTFLQAVDLDVALEMEGS